MTDKLMANQLTIQRRRQQRLLHVVSRVFKSVSVGGFGADKHGFVSATEKRKENELEMQNPQTSHVVDESIRCSIPGAVHQSIRQCGYGDL